jgi:hypothetical protein
MKIKHAVLGAFLLILSALHSPAVVDQTLQVQGTNLVLS